MLILALAAATLSFRLIPLNTLSRMALPAWAQEWLDLVPGAVLAASLAQVVLLQDGKIEVPWANPRLLAAIPALMLAWRTRSVLITMIGGMAAYALLQFFMRSA